MQNKATELVNMEIEITQQQISIDALPFAKSYQLETLQSVIKLIALSCFLGVVLIFSASLHLTLGFLFTLHWVFLVSQVWSLKYVNRSIYPSIHFCPQLQWRWRWVALLLSSFSFLFLGSEMVRILAPCASVSRYTLGNKNLCISRGVLTPILDGKATKD
ncbi:hypothetical protein TorRG33x02_191710 [Trema orientale]|uniref:Transmembrane protein n=1 Tax=Trema orientale TaxID=63057 RepID=A0A2P5EHQ6_TREOI|nr:hypothetical protein TorRG33x02_191710 [Trema orientale]